jgi:transcription initiation factor IIE alpha subunit
MKPDERPHSTPSQKTRWSTQDEAWKLIQPHLAGIGVRVFRCIEERPQTCDEVEISLGLTHQTCSATINKLMRDGVIISIGKRNTRSGRPACVWSIPFPDNLFQTTDKGNP